MSFLEELESLRIPFGDIKEATKDFTTVIGKGGYGLVYRGELLLSGKLTTVAVKRLYGNVSGQGFKEFLTEIQLLTRYKHPNLISLIGFCDQDNEKILIYEHAEHGSLDKYLSSAENRSKLTWKRRINICVNAARGLNFLHNEVAPNERVIHRDIKSANVLLDQDWKAMISDLGLSKLGRANEKDTFLITNASGTHGYCDPVYISSGILTKESDVFSFGVVLFEVLCGRPGFINVNSEHRFLYSLAQRHCKIGKIDEIMDPALKNQIDSDSLNKFSKIASQCLQNNRKRRPSMRTVVKKLEELENALELQEKKTEMHNPRAAGPEVPLIGSNLTLKGSPIDPTLRSGLMEQQKSNFMQGSQPFHQLQMMSPQQQQQLLLAQQNMTSQPSNDESIRHYMLLKVAQIQQQLQQQKGNQQQQQIHHSLSAPPPQNSNLNLQQEKIVGASSVRDRSMSNSVRGNDQAGRKRKQLVSSSGHANGVVQADMDRFVEDGSFDDTDMRDTVGHLMDVSEGFTFTEVNSVRASQSKVVCCHFSSDGKLLASGGHDKKAILWYTDPLKPKATLEEHTSMITDVRFSPSMSCLATSSFDKTVRVWDADNTGYSLRTFMGHSASVMSLDFHPNKIDLICSCDGDGEIRYWSLNNGCARVFKGATAQVRFQPRHGRFLAAAAENIVSILDVETQDVRYTLQGHTKPIYSVCWDPSGEYLASVSADSVRVWSLTAGNEGECVHELSCYGNQFHSCVFHPSYASLMVIGCYQSLELWNMLENKTMTLPAHGGLIADLALSTSTGLIASASHDKIVKLWK